MKKCENIKQLREVLRKIIINTQDLEEINNFNTLYDYSSITDMSYLWEKIEKIINKKKEFKEYLLKKDWKNINLPTLNMINVEKREDIFKNCSLYEINLINTHNVKDFTGRFEETKNLKRISLDLSSCIFRSYIFHKSNIKECELKNTHNIKRIYNGFCYTKNLEKISLDLRSCKERSYIFWSSGVREVELLNTQNIKNLDYGFGNCENLEKLNSLYLDNCENMIDCLTKTKLKEINLYNTGKVKTWYGCFSESNIEEVELDMNSRENCEYMFFNRKVKKINLKNCEKIRKMRWFMRRRKEIDYLEMNISNMENINNFIDGENNLKYLKLIGTEKQKQPKKKIKEEIYKLFFNKEQEKNTKPHIELEKKNTTFNIIGDNNSSMRLEKIKEKEKKREIKKEKLKSQKEYNIEINL